MNMEIGICAHPKDTAGLSLEAFDFIEVNVQSFLAPEKKDSDFQPHLDAAGRAIKPVKTANCFLPGDLKCVGPGIDHGRLRRHAERAFSRAKRTGIEIIVFGSGAARSVPGGYSQEHALEDFAGVLREIGPIARRCGVTLVIEPLNKLECNFINLLAEGAEAVERCDHPNVRLLADAYHMMKEGESASEIMRFGHLLRHVHLAELAGRCFPGKSREDFRPFFQMLRQAGYTGRVALECGWDDIRTDLAVSTRYLREQMAAYFPEPGCLFPAR